MNRSPKNPHKILLENLKIIIVALHPPASVKESGKYTKTLLK
jgi:hypothetical protein